MQYQVFQLKDHSRPGNAGLVSLCQEALAKQVTDQSGTVYGIFTALFGLASNELYLVTCSDRPVSLDLPEGVAQLACWQGLPTVRPLAHSARETPGIYVFRWFEVEPDNVNEIVELSGLAWPSFEADFDARIQGLFVEDHDQPSRMLLLTWYLDLSAWEASRKPSPDSRDNFMKRHQLTKQALPVATVLAGLPDSPVSISSR